MTDSNNPEVRLAALDASIARGIDDADSGRIHAIKNVARTLDLKYAALAGDQRD